MELSAKSVATAAKDFHSDVFNLVTLKHKLWNQPLAGGPKERVDRIELYLKALNVWMVEKLETFQI